MGWFSPSSSKLDWNLLTDENTFQNIVNLSFSEKVLIFKHSTRCSISSMSKHRLDSAVENSKIKSCFLLDLLKYREISSKIESYFKVTHESPQVLVILNGECIYNASHNEISWEGIP